MKLNWTKELEIGVTFANGTKEKIHLKVVADLNGEEIPCLYTGSLDHDAEDSAVTVDGCQGDTQVRLYGGQRQKKNQRQKRQINSKRNFLHKLWPKLLLRFTLIENNI